MARFDDLEDAAAIKTTPKWPFLIAALVVLGGGGWFAWQASTAADPLKVLVAVEIDGHWFEGSEPAARLADELNEGLEALGFEPIRSGDPEVVAVLEDNADDLRAAAKALRAGYVITGRLKPQVIEHPVAGGYNEVRVDGALEVFHVDDEGAETVPIDGWSGARERDRAVRLLTEGSVAKKAVARTLPVLLRHPIIAEKLEGDIKTMGKLDKAQRFFNARNRELRTADEAYAAYAERKMDKEKGPVKVTYHGSLKADDALAGTGPLGYLVKTEDITPTVLPRDNDLTWFEGLETLEWRTPEGEAKTLWSGYNVYSYPGVSGDGRTAALVEDLFGWAKTVTLIPADGESKRLKIDPEKRFSNLEPSHTGKYVAFYERECRRCPDELSVLKAADGEETFRTGNEGGGFDGYGWAGDEALVVHHTPAAPPEGEAPAEGEEPDPVEDTRMFPAARATIWRVPVEGGAPEAIYTVEEGTSLSWMKVSPDGKKAVFAARTPEGRGIAVLDLAQKTLAFHPAEGGISSPSWSPDGARIAFNIRPYRSGRDEEVAVVPAAGGEVKQLTDNPHRDRYPRFSHDGQRIYFESLGKDPNFPKRHVSVIASVPAQ